MADDRLKNRLLSFGIRAAFAIWTAAVFGIGLRWGRTRANLPVSVKVDTLTVRDTIREKYPVYLTRYVDRVELVPVTDTVRLRDTLWMAQEIERRTYAGDDYRAVVSGVRPSLEEIAVFPKTVYLQTEVTTPAPAQKRRTRAGVGIAAGPGVFWDGSQVKPGVGAIAGVSVTF